jgi:hypothetical protein
MESERFVLWSACTQEKSLFFQERLTGREKKKGNRNAGEEGGKDGVANRAFRFLEAR